MIEVYSDRSTYTKGKECPRSRWFGMEVPTSAGFGVVPSAWDPNLLVGSTFHMGVKELLEGKEVDEAWGIASQAQEKELKDGGLAGVEDSGAVEYMFGENRALAEALIRGYEKVVLPQVLDRFEVLSVEQEEVTDLEIPALPGFRVKFGGRTDGIFLEKIGSDLFVLSLKTKKEWKPGDDGKNRTDTQGLTEWIAVESRLGRWQRWLESGEFEVQPGMGRVCEDGVEIIPAWFVDRFLEGHSPTVFGVTMHFALKGKQDKDRVDGLWKHGSHLIRPWVKNLPGGGREWAWKFGWDDAMGGGHRLGKGWGRVNIWQAWNVKDWIEYLWEENVQELGPGAGLQASFILPEDYTRNEEDRENRIQQIVWEERRMQDGRERLIQLQAANASGVITGGSYQDAVEMELNRTFPQTSDFPVNCNYCEFNLPCYGPKVYLLDPIASGMFSPRVSNHPVEVKIRGRGLVRG